MQNNYEGWEEVPEEQIAEAVKMSEKMGGPALLDNQNFKKILLAGSIFKEAGLTPVYVWNEVSCKLAVYASETHGKKLH